MTEVQKFQGKFLERQRQEKEKAKANQKLKKVEKQTKGDSSDEETKDSKKANDKNKDTEEEISDSEAAQLRKLLSDGTEFKGIEKTIVSILKENRDPKKNKDGSMKIKQAAKMITKAFRLSEDFDSSDDSDDDDSKWLVDTK